MSQAISAKLECAAITDEKRREPVMALFLKTLKVRGGVMSKLFHQLLCGFLTCE